MDALVIHIYIYICIGQSDDSVLCTCIQQGGKMGRRKSLDFARQYFTAEKPGAYGGIGFVKTVPKNKREKAKAWLEDQDAYNLHRPVRRKFPRTKIVTSGLDGQWQIDLIDVSKYAKHNDGVKFLLTAIDCFSRYAYVRPLRRKDGVEVTRAFTDILNQGRVPRYVQSDRGKEFLNRPFQALLAERGVKFFTSHNDDIKCAIVERFNRTLQNRLHRFFTRKNTLSYLAELQNHVKGYNATIHKSTGFAPAKVTVDDQEKVWLRLYNKPPAHKAHHFKVGDHVRISKARHVFAKGYVGRWSDELFVIKKINRTVPVTFDLQDLAGEDITGVFYNQELVKAKPPEFWAVETILDQRTRKGKREYLIKWKGYPNKFNSWERDVKRT